MGSEYTEVISNAYRDLVFWREMDACCQRPKSLGMPESGVQASNAVSKAGNIREEYLTLCSIMQDLECARCNSLFNAWARGRGAKYVNFDTKATKFKAWARINITPKLPIWLLAGENYFDATLADFGMLVDDGVESFVPAQQTGTFIRPSRDRCSMD